jgi:hypothetical protein
MSCVSLPEQPAIGAYTHLPSGLLQESDVQGLPSLQVTAVPAVQVPL